jgi:hypothetical protein
LARAYICLLIILMRVDVALDRSRAVQQGQPVPDRVVVPAQAAHEPAQMRQVAGLDGRHPDVQPVTMAAGEHLGERGDMRGGVRQVRAGSQHLLELELLLGSATASLSSR